TKFSRCSRPIPLSQKAVLSVPMSSKARRTSNSNTSNGAKRLVVVESPTKARTIRGFLPPGYRVAASMGHVRDLPESASDIPASHKGKEWARLGVDVEHGFKPLYVVPSGKKKIETELPSLLKEADELILATGEDR